MKYMYFSMARAYDVTINRCLQRVLEAAEQEWKKKNREVKRIDQVPPITVRNQ